MSYKDIHDKAEEVAKKYNPQSLAPFPYESIVNDMDDLEVIYLDLKQEHISGAILLDGEKNLLSILINTNKSKNRQNFTLGHELGHYFLHKEIVKEKAGLIDGDGFLDGDNILFLDDIATTTRIETEANHFAASLLMPEQLVRNAWDATSGDIEEVAKIFKVSVVAMSMRLSKLGLVSS